MKPWSQISRKPSRESTGYNALSIIVNVSSSSLNTREYIYFLSGTDSKNLFPSFEEVKLVQRIANIVSTLPIQALEDAIEALNNIKSYYEVLATTSKDDRRISIEDAEFVTVRLD